MVRHTRGFSLVELMVVVAVIAIMLSVAVPTFNKGVSVSKERGAVQKLSADFQWARGAAVAPDASLFNSLVNTTLTGPPTVILTVNNDCSWTTTINGNTDPSHSMKITDLSTVVPNIGCNTGTIVPKAVFQFDPQGFVTTTGTLVYTGASSQSFTLQILHSGAMFRVSSEAS